MKDNNQNKPQSTESPLNQEKREIQSTSKQSGMKKLLSKKWFSPALFMITAALIVTLLWVFQDNNPDQPTTSTEVTNVEDDVIKDEDVPVTNKFEPDVAATSDDMKWPVADISAMQIEIPFYDTNATETEKEAALIQVGTTFAPHMGIDFVSADGESFDVLAALDGVVSFVESNPINGHVVEINHGNGLVTVYQSLMNVVVAEGDEVEQGFVIATAGRSEVEKDLGTHLHFETRLNGQNVNPNDYILE